jgi:Uri superfamily endonuclease
MIPGYVEFEFDLPKALLERLAATLDGTAPAPLTADAATQIGEVQGVYELFHKGKLVYVGKTDAKAGLRQRLSRHAEKVRHRIGLDPDDVSFKAVRIFVFTAMDLEADLIVHHAKDGKLAWNNSGFGANDPGRNRDRSIVKPDHFDARFPIDTDRSIGKLSFARGSTAAAALDALRSRVPYIVRYERDGGVPHPALSASTFARPIKPRNAREALTAIVGVLPAGWSATILKGYVIVYQERASYPSAQYQIKSA